MFVILFNKAILFDDDKYSVDTLTEHLLLLKIPNHVFPNS